MSNLVDRIAAVLREHHFRPVEDHWQCTAQACTGKWLSSSSEAAHVAERVAEALSLTEERRTDPMSSAGQTKNWKTGETTVHCDIRYLRRWVSPWTAVEDQP